MLTLVALLACAPPVEEAPVDPTDLVVTGLVYTGPGATWEDQAILIDGGHIRGVLPLGEELAYTGPDTQVVHAERVTAGFVDSHGHVLALGRQLSELDLRGVSTRDAVDEAIRTAGGEGWLQGGGWDHTLWGDDLPTAAELDALTGERPAALWRVDGHTLWVNSAALAAAGIDARTPDPEGGRIERDASGHPTGILLDAAAALVPLPQPTDADLEAWIRAGLAEVARHGLVGVHVMGSSDAEVAVYERLAAAGELPVRLWVLPRVGTDAAERVLTEGPWRSGHLAVVGVKDYADGALGSRGAWLSEDYADDPGDRGVPALETAEVTALLRRAPQGSVVAIHAIGDAAVDMVLAARQDAALRDPGSRGVLLRLEHAQVVSPSALETLSRGGVIASVQPVQATSDWDWATARLGPERVAWAYRLRDLVDDEDIPVAFGSDFPYDDLDPSHGLWAATTRTDADGEPLGGFQPLQAITVEQAIDGYTRGAAWAVGETERRGTIARGLEADLTLWTVDADGRWEATGSVVAGVTP